MYCTLYIICTVTCQYITLHVLYNVHYMYCNMSVHIYMYSTLYITCTVHYITCIVHCTLYVL